MIVAGLLPTIVAPVALAADVAAPFDKINGGTPNPPLSSKVCQAADFNFIIDMSGSIGAQGNIPSNLQDLKDGITGFVDEFELRSSGKGLYSGTRFNDNGATKLTTGYDSSTVFKGKVDALKDPAGMTPTAAGINTGVANSGGDRDGIPNVMFVVTDGSPNVPNSHGDDLTNPDSWVTGANAAIAAADAARAQGFVVKSVYLSTDGDPGDVNLPFSPTDDAKWATKVMNEIGGGSHLNADFKSFVDDLFKSIGCEPPKVSIEKTADNKTVDAGAQIGFTIKVTNSSADSVATNVVVTDNLPDTAGTDWSINPAVEGCKITGDPGDQALTCDFGTLAAKSSASVHVVTGTGASCGNYDNTAKFTATDIKSDEASASVKVLCAGIGITKVHDAASVIAGDPIGFTITVTSKGPATATGVVLTDALPTDAGTSWSIDGGTAKELCSIASGKVTCNLGDMAEDANYTVHITSPTTKATVADSPVDNTAKVTTTNDGKDEASDNVVVVTRVIDASIKLVKTAGSAADGAELVLEKPGNVTFKYVVTNTGPTDLQNVKLVDDNATPGDTSDDVTVTGCAATLAAGASTTCTVTMAVGEGLRTNIAKVTAEPVLDPEAPVTATDNAVVRVPEPEVTPTPTPTATPTGSPKVTPPPTSTLDNTETPSGTGNGLLLVLFSLAGLMLVVGYLVPTPARARRRNRRG